MTLLFHKAEMLCIQEASCIQMRLKSVGVVDHLLSVPVRNVNFIKLQNLIMGNI